MDKSVTGVVTDVRDERFELLDDAAQRHVFMLAMDATFGAAELRGFQRDGSRVTIDYDDETPDTHIAHRAIAAPARSAGPG